MTLLDKTITANTQAWIWANNKMYLVNLHIAFKVNRISITVGAVYDFEKDEFFAYMHKNIFFTKNLIEEKEKWTRLSVIRVSHHIRRPEWWYEDTNSDTHTLFEFLVSSSWAEERYENKSDLKYRLILWIRFWFRGDDLLLEDICHYTNDPYFRK